MKKILFAGFITFLIVFSFSFSKAASYDIYVDKSYDEDDSDGSSGKPFKTISKAVKEAGSNDRIYVKNGKYDEDFSLKKGLEIYGENRDKTIIYGTIESKGDNTIKNITVSGSTYGIIASGKIEIEDCGIKNSGKIGIDLSESKQEASIIDSIISNNKGKGIYVQRTRSITIRGNSIYSNAEEGLDIRERVNGIVEENEITGNGEGGIEFIVGGSNVTISDNIIKKNKASGIASQFYSFIEKTGSINIKDNTISQNGKYGFGCGIPSGGAPSSSYWNESINLKNNRIENNKFKAVDSLCNIIRVVDEEEEKENITTEENSSQKTGEETDDKATKIISGSDPIEEKENNEIKEQLLKERLIEQLKFIDNLSYDYEQEMDRIGKRNKLKTFFFGTSEKELDLIKEKIGETEEQISIMENMLSETNMEESRNSISETIENMKTDIEKMNGFIEEEIDRFSLFGWIFRIFRGKK
jgi:parallel beta-helix repeat protein